MAWIEVHDTLPDHRKTLDAAEALKMDPDMVVGKLIRLWTWALNNREDGNIKARDAQLVADVMRFRGKAQRLLDALVATGFLDRTEDGYEIHDWDQHVCMLREKREKIRSQTRERVKRYRAQKTQENATVCNALQERYSNADETRNETQEYNVRNAVTVPYHTEPEIYTTATAATTRARMREETAPELRDSQYAALIDTYTQNIRMPSAIEAESIDHWLSDMPAEVIDFAIKQAALSGIRSWRGVETILLRWKEIGVHDLPSAQAAQREWSSRAQANQPRAAPRPQGTLGRALSNLDALMAQTLEEEHGRCHQS